MKRKFTLILLTSILISACNLARQPQIIVNAILQTAPASTLTETLPSTTTYTSTYTSTSTATPTATSTFTTTFTPTLSPTPTITFTPTITLTPTFDFPKVTVNVALAACLFGPAKSYLWKFDLHQGDTGFVGGRAPVGNWLYVKFDRLPDYCWVSPYVVAVIGDVNTVTVQPILLWITNALYSAPKNIRAVRKKDQVTVTWNEDNMTEDDDRGYFLDVWVCQGGNYVWMPTALPDEYHTSATFTDQAGCSQPSGGKLYTVEKHGYTSPANIPWPAYK